jgi:hypothetical protein
MLILVVSGLGNSIGLGAIPIGVMIGLLIWWFYQGVPPRKRS